MEKLLTDIKEDVRVAIDENRSTTGLADMDTLELDAIIVSKIEDGMSAVYTIAPVRMINEWEIKEYTSADNGYSNGKGTIVLPDYFARLVRVKADSWKRAVLRVTTPDMDEYAQQFSEFVGIRGNASRPVAIVSEGAAEESLDLFSIKADDKVTLDYLEIKKSADNKYDIPSKLYRAVVYKIAALVVANYEQGNLIQLLNSLCLEQLGMSSGN